MSGTLLAFDFGTKSIGVAVGQRITGTARPLPAIKAQDGTPDWNIIERLLKEWQPDEIIVGLPLNMDGTEQPLTARARKFANRIHGRFGVEVKLHDERLSTVEARSGLFEQGGYRALNKGKVDSASAVIILESYFENNNRRGRVSGVDHRNVNGCHRSTFTAAVTHLSEKDLVETLSDSALLSTHTGRCCFFEPGNRTSDNEFTASLSYCHACSPGSDFPSFRGLHLRT